jgi:hypothetical protein
VGFREKLDGG